MPVTMLRGAILVSLVAAPCLGQTGYNGLVPGRSSRSEVASVLGQPVGGGTATQLEYPHPENMQSLSVRYRDAASAMESLQLVLLFPALRPPLVEYFGLPARADVVSRDAEGRLVEYFGAPKYLSFTYAGGDSESGIRAVVFHSPESWQRSASSAGAAGVAAGAQAPPVSPPAGPVAPSSQAPGSAVTMALSYRRLSLTLDECMRRAERALGMENYRIDVVRNPRFILAGKLVFAGGIVCEEAANGQIWVNVIVSAPTADRAAADQERANLLQHMTEGLVLSSTPAPGAPSPAPMPAPAPATPPPPPPPPPPPAPPSAACQAQIVGSGAPGTWDWVGGSPGEVRTLVAEGAAGPWTSSNGTKGQWRNYTGNPDGTYVIQFVTGTNSYVDGQGFITISVDKMSMKDASGRPVARRRC